MFPCRTIAQEIEKTEAVEEIMVAEEIADAEQSGLSYLENHSVALSITVSYWRELFLNGGLGLHIPLADKWELGVNFGYENLYSPLEVYLFLNEAVGGLYYPGTLITSMLDINRYMGVSSNFGTYVGASIFSVFWIPGELSVGETFESMTSSSAVVGGTLYAAACWFPYDRVQLAAEYHLRYRRSNLPQDRIATGIDSIVLMKLSFKPF